jgi:hypothetical protein
MRCNASLAGAFLVVSTAALRRIRPTTQNPRMPYQFIPNTL